MSALSENASDVMSTLAVIVDARGSHTSVTLRDRSSSMRTGLATLTPRTKRRLRTFGGMTVGGFGVDTIVDGSGGIEHVVDNVGQFAMMVGELGLMTMATVAVLNMTFGRGSQRHAHEVTYVLTQEQFDAFWTWYSTQDKPTFLQCDAAIEAVLVGHDIDTVKPERASVFDAEHWWIDESGGRIYSVDESSAEHEPSRFERDEDIRARLDEVSRLDLTATQSAKINSIVRSRDDLIAALSGIPETEESRQMVKDIVDMWNAKLDDIVADVNARGLDRLRSVRQYVADIDHAHDGLDLSKMDEVETKNEASE